MHRYKCYNAAMATTAALTKVAVANGVKTMLQIATPSTRQCQLIAWGFNLDVALAGRVELIQTDVAATVTAHVAAGVQPLDPNAPPSLMTLGTGATGFTATVEGTTAASRTFDQEETNVGNETFVNYFYQWMPDERPIVAVSKFLRVRATYAAATSNMLCWVVWDE